MLSKIVAIAILAMTTPTLAGHWVVDQYSTGTDIAICPQFDRQTGDIYYLGDNGLYKNNSVFAPKQSFTSLEGAAGGRALVRYQDLAAGTMKFWLDGQEILSGIDPDSHGNLSPGYRVGCVRSVLDSDGNYTIGAEWRKYSGATVVETEFATFTNKGGPKKVFSGFVLRPVLVGISGGKTYALVPSYSNGWRWKLQADDGTTPSLPYFMNLIGATIEGNAMVIASQKEGDPLGYYIYRGDIETGAIQMIAYHATNHLQRPIIAKGRIAWEENVPWGGPQYVQVLDENGHRRPALQINHALENGSPDFDGNKIVWSDSNTNQVMIATWDKVATVSDWDKY